MKMAAIDRKFIVKRMNRRTRWIRCSFLLLVLHGGWVFAACDIVRQTELDLTVLNGHFNMPVRLGEVERLMVIDTGAEDTILSEKTVQELGFSEDPLHYSIMTGVATRGNKVFNAYVPIFGFGNILARNRSTAVADMGGLNIGPIHPAGLIGGDILSQYDIEIDFPLKKIVFYRIEGCAGKFIPWSVNYATIPLTRKGTRVFMTIDVNEHKLNALIDTGAAGMFIKRKSVLQAGVTEDDLEHDTTSNASGAGGTPVEVRIHRFSKMTIGNQTFSNITVNVPDVPLPAADMVLPAAYLKFRKVWISYATNQMFIADIQKKE
jgi:predicted aspartyl protease